MNDILYLVVPCYNESEAIDDVAEKLTKKLDALITTGTVSSESKLCFVNDGSKDDTADKIRHLCLGNKRITAISLSHNSGEQNAYMAGMSESVKHSDVIITTDCDLQDDIDAIDKMLEKYSEGYDIVYGVRESRKGDSFIKKITSHAFYKLMNLLGTELINEHSQYRLMSRRAVESLLEYKETDLFLPALIPTLGYKHTIVKHSRDKRVEGKSHYNFSRLFSLALTAIVSFSTKPIKLISLFSAISFLLGLSGIIYLTVRGISAAAVAFTCIWLAGGLILISIRIIGEYIAMTLHETKGRPRYIIEENYLDKSTHK